MPPQCRELFYLELIDRATTSGFSGFIYNCPRLIVEILGVSFLGATYIIFLSKFNKNYGVIKFYYVKDLERIENEVKI